VLGVQRNVCISPFTRESGATAFKLGSSAYDQGPPASWGLGGAYDRPGHRAEFGLPYCGPEADVVETPGGSIILYDSRTWHRAGVSAIPKRRSAMLQAMIPAFMMPFFDCSSAFHDFLKQPFLTELNNRELAEIQSLMINHMEIGQHRMAIRPDPVLTDLLKDAGDQFLGYPR
jgi:ectoine hydroxylase-related dioxygenase (phytanoyl-CoA dioxygenase family)